MKRNKISPIVVEYNDSSTCKMSASIIIIIIVVIILICLL